MSEVKNNKKIIIIGLSIVLIIAVVVAFVAVNLGSSDKPVKVVPANTAVNEQSNFVTGTGILEADNQLDVNTTVMGDVISSPFEEGQYINAGDLLYQIDSTDIKNSIEQGRLSVEKAELAYNQGSDNLNKLSVRSSLSGTITKLYINTGDILSPNAKVADVVNDDVMVLKVPFIKDTTQGIYQGQSATVTIVGSFYTVDGIVKKVTTGHMTTSDGSVVKIIEINVPNPGTLKKGDKGTAIINGVACNDSGEFDYSSYETISAEISGTVGTLNRSVGDHLNKNDVIVSLENDTIVSAQQQNSLSVKVAKLSLDNLNNQLKDYNITSQINGTAIKKNIKSGDTIDATNKSKMAIVADLTKIIFKMNIDELDVSRVSVGQKVIITADAVPDKEFSGSVEFVGVSGIQVSGVTLYEITVAVDNPDQSQLMPGMNVNAKIIL